MLVTTLAAVNQSDTLHISGLAFLRADTVLLCIVHTQTELQDRLGARVEDENINRH